MKPTNTNKPEHTLTMADHAEAWQTERGRKVPKRGTPEWQAMYEEWVEFAFQDFGGKT